MTRAQLADFIKGAWRPFMGFGGAGSLIAGMFAPSVTPEKMAVMAGLLGTLGYFRTVDKKAALQAGTDPAQPQPPPEASGDVK